MLFRPVEFRSLGHDLLGVDRGVGGEVVDLDVVKVGRLPKGRHLVQLKEVVLQVGVVEDPP